MADRDLLLGVDGGGGATRALLADTSGVVVGRGEAGPSNYHIAGLDAAGRALREAIDQAWHGAGRGRIVAACFGLASVDQPSDQLLVHGWVVRQGLTDRFSIVNDSELVLTAGTPDGWGLALLCGAGSICIGRTEDGRAARAGGWGYRMGDEGSGYFLGIQCLRLATQTADGRASAHALLDAVLEHWGLDHADHLLSFVYRPETTHAEIASLSERVFELAAAGDDHAVDLVDGAARALAEHVDAVASRVHVAGAPLALGGSLLASSEMLREKVRARIGVPIGVVTVVKEPARGALLLARRLFEEA